LQVPLSRGRFHRWLGAEIPLVLAREYNTLNPKVAPQKPKQTKVIYITGNHDDFWSSSSA